MEIVWVIVAGLAGWIFGAVWYGVFAKQWQAAVGLTQDDLKFGENAGVYIGSVIANILVAGMMRHVFVTSGVEGIVASVVSGLGLGLFIAGSFLWLNYSFSKKPMSLKLIDIGHAAGSSALIGLVLGLTLGAGGE